MSCFLRRDQGMPRLNKHVNLRSPYAATGRVVRSQTECWFVDIQSAPQLEQNAVIEAQRTVMQARFEVQAQGHAKLPKEVCGHAGHLSVLMPGNLVVGTRRGDFYRLGFGSFRQVQQKLFQIAQLVGT